MARQLGDYALAAKLIRQELKKSFPLIKFSVTSKSYSMGDHVRVSWTNGPTREAVEAITNKYEYGQFNGMEDIYEYSNVRKDIPQTKYLHVDRHVDESIYDILFIFLKSYYQYFKDVKSLDTHVKFGGIYRSPREEAWMILSKLDLTNGLPSNYLPKAA